MTLTNRCNFNCRYCFDRITKIFQQYKKAMGTDDLVRFIDSFKMSKVVRITGGEPFLYPGFIDLCSRLSENNMIDISTNLSHKSVYKFAEKISAEYVKNIQVTAHMEELEKYKLLDEFIHKINLLKEMGFSVIVYYLAHPKLLKRFQKDSDLFRKHEINLTMKVFRGRYLGRLYPNSYSDAQQDLIRKNSDEYNIPQLKRRIVKGKPCLAGKNLLIIDSDGQVYRCYGEKKAMGRITEPFSLKTKAEKCPMKYCPCPSHALMYLDA